ncbi:MAG: circadian clock protein KaiC [Myxococcales bacterium]|nr:MAG: circadian clock protein KaiC [Myxococcales bacterium]
MAESREERASTGIRGLDDVLNGGLPTNRMYLVKGAPGVGKTTLAIQFLLEGVRRGETALYITLSETEQEIRQVAGSHGWNLEGLSLFELSVAEQTLRLREENTLYASEDVDLKELMGVLLARLDELKPARVVFDSLSEIRLLANSSTRYRRQLLSLKQDLIGRDVTTLLLDDRSSEHDDVQVESLAHGVIVLEQTPVQYGAERRRVRVAKLRGSAFRSGFHDYIVGTGGIAVFPRLIAAEHRTELSAQPISSGVPRLDAMLGGGIDRSTATLVLGPAGVGKSALAAQFAIAAALRGEHSSVFLFEERLSTWLKRSEALGVPATRLVKEGKVGLQQIDPAELAPDEFTHAVRLAVERDHAKVVVIDSITGYFNAMPEARFLSLQMHELLSYLAERGVATLLTMAQTGMFGTQMTSAVDMSYLADSVVVMRYFEAGGHLKKAVSVLKKRSGPHENTIRSLAFGPQGLDVGDALVNLQGVLTGIPRQLNHSEGALDPG